MKAEPIRAALAAESTTLLRRAADFSEGVKNLQVATSLARHALALLEAAEVVLVHFPSEDDGADAKPA